MSAFAARRYDPNAKTLSDRAYYLTIACVLLFGFGVNALMVGVFADKIANVNPLAFIISYCIMVPAGIIINVFSRRAWLSFIGYCMVVLPLGMFLALLLPLYAVKYVFAAFVATFCITGAMVIFAAFFPSVFYSYFKLISICVLVGMLANLILALCGRVAYSDWLSWLITALFAAYIGLDVCYARNRPKTLDSAIDSACGLYVDIIYVFLRLLAIIARNKD